MSEVNVLAVLDCYLDALRTECWEARDLVSDLIDSHARLLALCEAARLPKTADDLAPMVEARRIAAAISGGTPT